MKRFAILAMIVAAAACGHHDRECTGLKATHVEMMRVDDNTPLMKSWYAHVGQTKADAATDPVAIEAGITAGIDMWKTEDGSQHQDYYVKGPTKDAIARYVASLPPELAVPSDHKLVYQHVLPLGGEQMSPFWRTYLVSSSVLLDQTSIVNIRAANADGRPAVWVDFSKDGGKTFANVTEAAVGHKIATLIDGDVISAPIIMSAITGGIGGTYLASAIDGFHLQPRCSR